MKRTAKYIIILLAVLAVLGGATVLLLNLPQDGTGEESSAPSSSETELVKLFDRQAEEVQSVDVENTEDSFSLVLESGGSEETNFTLEGYGGYDLWTSTISANVRTLLGFNAVKDLGSQENLEAFGLGSDAVKITVHYKDGSSEKLLLGTDAGETAGRYALKNDNVYIVAGVPAEFYGSKFSYFNTEVYTIADRTEAVAGDDGNTTVNTVEDLLSSMELSGAHYPDPISIESTSKCISGYMITEPVTAESGNTAFNELVTSLKSLTATVVDAGLSDEKLEEYGLAEPDARIVFELNNSKHSMAVSAKDSDGKRYLIADDTDTVYVVENSAVEKWAEGSLLGLRMSYIWIANIKDVEEVSITAGGETHSYHVTRTVNEEKSTDTNTDYDLTIVDAGGNDISYDDAYQPFYQKLISLAVFSQDQVELSGTPDIQVQYKYFNGGSDSIALYKVEGQNRYAAALNGQFNGLVRGGEVEAMLETIP